MNGERCCAVLAGLLAVAAAGCTSQPPTMINAGLPMQYGAVGLPPGYYARPPLPARLAPTLPPPRRAYEEPSYAPEPPYSDGTPFSLDAPPAPEPAPSAPSAAETPPPVRTAAPTPSVPLVGFRPMRPLGRQSY